jgi:hypothetical protein
VTVQRRRGRRSRDHCQLPRVFVSVVLTFKADSRFDTDPAIVINGRGIWGSNRPSVVRAGRGMKVLQQV